ncbi:BamA/TamA family outer membrane protein [uncultured Shimia sp.]|uniref:BamA/TamA family outer membrane protein n=1 Tax=uncultured Shimia sp. TaxID=573152 RepID=UPI00261925CD|nr:BamA/TamA family outer membrane protein [uncultured Shimia sp.]
MGFTGPVLSESGLETSSNTLSDVANDETDFGFRNGSFLFAPIPFKTPTIGAGLALGGGYLFEMDAGSDTSSLAAGALYSDNGSFAYGLSGDLSWDSNRWKLSATLAHADAIYDLFVGGTPVGLQQEGYVFTSTLLYGLSENFSLGGKVRYLDTTIGLADGGALPPDLDDDSELKLWNMGLVAQYDSRDDDLYPRGGYFVDFELSAGTTVEGTSREYARGFVNAAGYWLMAERTVLAG